jgi:hypothetical protein
VPNVDQFIADLKDAVADARFKPSGKGSLVTIYGKSPPFLLIPFLTWGRAHTLLAHLADFAISRPGKLERRWPRTRRPRGRSLCGHNVQGIVFVGYNDVV